MEFVAEIWPSLYQDSVVLMRIASQVRGMPDVCEAAAVMGTPANHAILDQAGMTSDATRSAGPNDLVFAVRAETRSAAVTAIDRARELLTERRRPDGDGDVEVRPRTLETALRRMPDATLAVISIAGAYVAYEAEKAMKHGLAVMIFSDNVPVADELRLKNMAVQRGLLCMGPDCGTAYINGAGLAFYNAVSRGRVGCIAASGTGLQAVACRLDDIGEGISQGIGVGGRDLSAEIGGLMTFAALDVLAGDPATEVVVVISKPPAPEIAAGLDEKLATLGKPSVVCYVGSETRIQGKMIWVGSLDGAANAAKSLLEGRAWRDAPFTDIADTRTRLKRQRESGAPAGGGIHGYYTGGTLAHEAHAILNPLLGPIHTNLGYEAAGGQHLILDLGDDTYTVGRPHPMIEPEVRIDAMRAETVSALPGVLLIDLVLGRGAHENPAGPIALEIERMTQRARSEGRELVAVAAVIGTAADPQNLADQIEQLENVGAEVFRTNAEAVRFAALLVSPESEDVLLGGSE
jgi:FdrA protein